MMITRTMRLVAAFCVLQAFVPAAELNAAPEPPRAIGAPSVIPLLVLNGGTQSLGVLVSGDAPFQYQWSRDGQPLLGASSDVFTITGASAADTGRYRVRVTNSAGSAEFLVANVVVNYGVLGTDDTARAFRLMDYYFPRVEGAEWLYTGSDAETGLPVDSRFFMADLDRSITCFTGRGMPSSYSATALAVDGAFGNLSGTVFTLIRTWTDYMAVAPGAIAMWGDDYFPGIESARLDGSAQFPGTLTIGQMAEQRVDTYEQGTYIGRTWIMLRLLGVESVTTPAGRFDNCLHLRVEMQVPGSSATRIYDEWWAAGVGKVRRQWIEGPGNTVNSLLQSYQLPAATRFRLADYFVSEIPGGVFNSTGTSADGSPSNTVSSIIGTSESFTTYSGAVMPGTAGTAGTQLGLVSQNISTTPGGAVQETCAEYFTTAAGLVYWGLDNPTEIGSVRFEGGVALPVDLALGESVTTALKAYVNGIYAGPGNLEVGLVGVENCTVPAGTFANCLRLRFTIAFATQHQSYEMWMAPTVGCVRYSALSGAGQRQRNLVAWAVPRVPVVEFVGGNGGGQPFFKVVANGTGPMSYQWYRGETGDLSHPIAAATSAAFQTPVLTACTCYWARVINALGHGDTVSLLVEPASRTTDFAFWTLTQGLPASCRGMNSTPAGDGVPNILKYALGVEAMKTVTMALPVPVVIDGQPGERHVGLEFIRNVFASDLRLELEVSPDLKTWTVAPSTLELARPNWGEEYVRLREIAPLGMATRRFERLKVSIVP